MYYFSSALRRNTVLPETPSLTAKKSTVGSVKRNAYSESDQQQQHSAKLPRITLDDEGRTGYDYLETGNLLKAFKNTFFKFCLSVAGEISVELHSSFCVQSFEEYRARRKSFRVAYSDCSSLILCTVETPQVICSYTCSYLGFFFFFHSINT